MLPSPIKNGNMKKKIALVLVVAGVCTFAYMNTKHESRKVISTVALANIEALASGEEDTYKYSCYGEGSVDCPDGSKAEIVYKYLSLD